MQATPLRLGPGDRERLVGWLRTPGAPAWLVLRARIVLLAADGVSHTAIAARLGVSRQTVVTWRTRYERSGVAGLQDQPRSGRPRDVDRAAIIAATLTPPPEDLGVRCWSSRLLARRLQVDHATVARTWTEYGVRPGRRPGTFAFSTDPGLTAHVTDIAGLYLAPAQNAIVLSVGDSPAARARGAAPLPAAPALCGGSGADPGVSSLSAAVQRATYKVAGHGRFRPRPDEVFAFLRHVVRSHPDGELHLVVDNATPHTSAGIGLWLAGNPRVKTHATATRELWVRLVDVWCFLVENRLGQGDGEFTVRALGERMREFADA